MDRIYLFYSGDPSHWQVAEGEAGAEAIKHLEWYEKKGYDVPHGFDRPIFLDVLMDRAQALNEGKYVASAGSYKNKFPGIEEISQMIFVEMEKEDRRKSRGNFL